MRIVKSMNFDAAHFLDHDPNARPYARLHGHSFVLEVTIEGDPHSETGWVVDFGDVDEALGELHNILDHRLLNEIEGLERPTLENICQWVGQKLKGRFPGLAQVRVSRPSNGESCIYDL
ncbi:6-carboxytetrahydropterin synthase QueD [Hyphococcus flavus]|uniref:6-carboxy-5,6,7,8-tetrahydropterin synthase n=1 Tax=Hyphococcus flavus TaxID=1866326 RepID=A0AAE9ZD50_9PROT|nr:6-carboxytetrahydropterin synthase QueD [Hyphococcus flavus]WDI30438.1 6-carboxytetrahydropterin synthase QueD [Hyphococcus flavus]